MAATSWKQEEIASLAADYAEVGQMKTDAVTQYNPTPGTGRTGYMTIPPNNYPFYKEEEKYKPVVQPDGGQLSGTPAWRARARRLRERSAEENEKRLIPFFFLSFAL